MYFIACPYLLLSDSEGVATLAISTIGVLMCCVLDLAVVGFALCTPYIQTGSIAIATGVYECASDGSACSGVFGESLVNTTCAHVGFGVSFAGCLYEHM